MTQRVYIPSDNIPESSDRPGVTPDVSTAQVVPRTGLQATPEVDALATKKSVTRAGSTTVTTARGSSTPASCTLTDTPTSRSSACLATTKEESVGLNSA